MRARIAEEKVLDHGPRENHQVALTFDDGPGPYTKEVLRVLKTWKVPATFFLVGQQIGYFPTLPKEVLAEGHLLGGHSWSHTSYLTLDKEAVLRDLGKMSRAIQEASGHCTHFFRFPYGASDKDRRQWVSEAGYVMVGWDSLGNDALRQPLEPVKIAQEVLSTVRGGSIILLHDGGGSKAQRERTLIALPLILEGLRQRQLRVVPLTQLLQQTPYRQGAECGTAHAWRRVAALLNGEW